MTNMFTFFKGEAPDFPVGLTWFNATNPLTMKMLRGHIIVLDFWTYCCINCMHTLPDIAVLEKKYHGHPVAFIGVHTPKFDNERDAHNVEAAIERYHIAHPVVLDADREIWTAYNAQGWPTLTVIDAKGQIAYQESGEGQRTALDAMIAKLLAEGKEQGALAKKSAVVPVQPKPRRRETLSYPGKICYDAITKELVIADSNNNRIILAVLEGSTARVIAQYGDGTFGLRDGPGNKAHFFHPQGVARQGDFIYVADTENHVIRRIDIKKNAVETVAGTGARAFGRPIAGHLNSPWDVAIVRSHLYIAMAGAHQLWRMHLETRELERYAGTGQEDLLDGHRSQAHLAQPSGLAADGDVIYFCDSETSSLRFIDTRDEQVNTLIGSGLFDFGSTDGLLEEAKLQHPLGLDVRDGTIYVADTYNHSIRTVNLSARQVKTLIGMGEQKVCRIGDRDCESLRLFEPNDVVAYTGGLIIADTNNHLIRIFDGKDLIDVSIQF